MSFSVIVWLDQTIHSGDYVASMDLRVTCTEPNRSKPEDEDFSPEDDGKQRDCLASFFVIARLDRAIHSGDNASSVDARVEPEHDWEGMGPRVKPEDDGEWKPLFFVIVGPLAPSLHDLTRQSTVETMLLPWISGSSPKMTFILPEDDEYCGPNTRRESHPLSPS